MNVNDFTSHVWDVVQDLNDWKFKKEKLGEPFYISEFWDDEGYQYINLIQEGGGMLGVALAGFTYVFEKMGIRFLGLAGTSAGSINSYLMAAIGHRNEAKSERILKHLINKDFMDFIDGGRDAKALIRFLTSDKKKTFINIITKPILFINYWDLKSKKGMNPGLKFEQWLDEILVKEYIFEQIEVAYTENNNVSWTTETFVESLYACSKDIHVYKADEYISNFEDYITTHANVNALEAFKTYVERLKLLKGSNTLEKDEFVEASNKILQLMATDWSIKLTALNVSELDLKMNNGAKDIFIYKHNDFIGRDSNNNQLPNSKEYVNKPSILALIAAELTTQTKVIFPEMSELYFKDVERVNPSKLVRASMSVPVLFEPVKLSLDWANPKLNNYNALREKWYNWCRYKGELPKEVFLVDGGIMSNFPIDVFDEIEESEERNKGKENNDVKTYKHTTTIGVKLGIDRLKPKTTNTLFSLIGQCFENARTVRDLESINKNAEVSDESIAYINTDDFNWLDFQMKDEKLKQLFRVGAESAAQFIKNFNYSNYKKSIEGKASKIVKQKLLGDLYESDYYTKLYEVEKKVKQDNIITNDELVALIDQLRIPQDVRNYWVDETDPNIIKYSMDGTLNDIKTKEIDNTLYHAVMEIQKKTDNLKNELDQNLVPSIKNVILRISLIRSCFDMHEIKTLNKFPVLWLRESVNLKDPYTYDELLTDIIDYAGGKVENINYIEEAQRVNNQLDYYKIIIVKAYDSDVKANSLKLFEALKLKANSNVIAYIPDAKTNDFKDERILVCNHRIDLLHMVLDIFHRNIYTLN